ncbi:hypothetical protein [Acinetobacter kanungonis]|uniref:hypothetical protein n=1 Tax=Acinetobacter kanungonis TaxID=2699469 RepID=UPI00137AA3D4|nr:hypothetical protein [Acinetobacter kanungonis]NCI78598.1 hypothetical protein [Acinetobacter kanungonis]
MSIFLGFLGFLILIICPAYFALYMEAKGGNEDKKKIIFILAFLPGVLVLALAAYLKEDKPIELSQACGVVKFYKTYAVKRDHFERITIQFEHSKYNRHLRFDEKLLRKSKGEYVCFEYLDKFKYSDLAESKILRWINE